MIDAQSISHEVIKMGRYNFYYEPPNDFDHRLRSWQRSMKRKDMTQMMDTPKSHFHVKYVRTSLQKRHFLHVTKWPLKWWLTPPGTRNLHCVNFLHTNNVVVPWWVSDPTWQFWHLLPVEWSLYVTFELRVVFPQVQSVVFSSCSPLPCACLFCHHLHKNAVHTRNIYML